MNRDVAEALRKVKETKGWDSIDPVLHKHLDILFGILKPKPKFYRNQPVLAKYTQGTYQSDFLSEVLENRSDKYKCRFHVNPFNDCKPDPEAKSFINWIEHDGITKFFEVKEGTVMLLVPTGEVTPWVAYPDNPPVEVTEDTVRYAFIPLPEFLDLGKQNDTV